MTLNQSATESTEFFARSQFIQRTQTKQFPPLSSQQMAVTGLDAACDHVANKGSPHGTADTTFA